MCGRFASQLPADVIHKLFAAAGPTPNLAPNWNVVPIQDAMAGTARR